MSKWINVKNPPPTNGYISNCVLIAIGHKPYRYIDIAQHEPERGWVKSYPELFAHQDKITHWMPLPEPPEEEENEE